MATLTADEIIKLLPHRYPMLLIDRVVECDDRTRIVAIKNVSANEPFFQGHFPGAPIMPGVLQLEAMAQAGGVLIMRIASGAPGLPFFMAIDKARFRKLVKPGDQMRIEVEIAQIRGKVARFRARILVEGVRVSEAELMCMLSDQKVAP
ncbi:MAG: 3-hydroxyacyl-ACP dehydratase FabZ [Verrucomicrobiota bacterium]|nr:3-hydroxyacyl-ACP dehydratase FabZ [Verrucomicrobiota bacterium]